MVRAAAILECLTLTWRAPARRGLTAEITNANELPLTESWPFSTGDLFHALGQREADAHNAALEQFCNCFVFHASSETKTPSRARACALGTDKSPNQ